MPDDSARRHLHWPPGLHREKAGSWRREDGTPVTDRETLARLASLAIPPAWQDVWAAEDPGERIQARGIDSRGRVQYRYSQAAQQEAARNKYAHMLHYAEALPQLRRRVARELRREPHSPDLNQVTALAGRFLDLGLFRVGSDRYVQDNHTYGLTTLLTRHVQVEGDSVRFDFIGKEHLRQQHEVRDEAAARVTRRLLTGYRGEGDDERFLFVAVDPTPRRIRAATLNSYIHAATGAAASAKTARTWGGTVIAAAVAAGARFDGEKKRRDPSLVAFDAASHVLGNTPTMARSSYVHPQALGVGASQEVRSALREAIGRQGTELATEVFVDEAFQEAVRRGLAAE